MFFIKYAPVHYRRLLTSIYLLFWLAVILMWLDTDLNFITVGTFYLEDLYNLILVN